MCARDKIHTHSGMSEELRQGKHGVRPVWQPGRQSPQVYPCALVLLQARHYGSLVLQERLCMMAWVEGR